MTLFNQARNCITRDLIERVCSSPDAYWNGDEYWCLAPHRADAKVGSFHISTEGLWHDFATGEGGDLIDLICKRDGCEKKAAARTIVELAGQTPTEDTKPTQSAKKKTVPVIPVPNGKIQDLFGLVKTDRVRGRHGDYAKGWRYLDADGGLVFCVVRYDKPDGSKDVIPYYYGDDGKWHEGQAMKDGRPLYHLDRVLANPTLPVLVVEGEKCADVAVPGYVVTTWSGGSAAVAKTDWSPLSERDVTIWPDADEPGTKAATAVKARLPHARVLVVSGRPKGWDIADAVAEGVDPVGFIGDSGTVDGGYGDQTDPGFYRCLGYDSEKYWFLTRNQRLPYTIKKGHFSGSQFLELAPLDWWSAIGFTSEQGAIRVAHAQTYVIEESERVGMFDIELLRGAGVWMDGGQVIINDGRQIVLQDGEHIELNRFVADAYYLASETRFGDMSGEASTADEGRRLYELFQAQGFMRPFMALAAFGWSMIAPFGGLLRWRPHLWVTGRKGSGKSFVLESLIQPLCGPFAHMGSGKDTEAGIRRTLNMDSRPVILDEMEPKSKHARERVSSILDLVRNSSGDGSGHITMAAADGGTIKYLVRSLFCLASVNVPEEGAAIGSRIIQAELQVPTDEWEKLSVSKPLYARTMSDPGRYRRRMFRAINRVLNDIAFLRDALLVTFGDQRSADTFAPIIAAAWAAMSDESVDSRPGEAWVGQHLEDLSQHGRENIEDEDRVMEHILTAQVKTDDGTKMRTIAELLRLVAMGADGYAGQEATLSRHGLRLVHHVDGVRCLAIATSADPIRRMLAGSPYEAGYDAQLRRNPLCVNSQETIQVSMGIGRVRCRLLDWDSVRNRYLEDGTI